MLTALTRPTGPELQQCELTHLDRSPIDIGRACGQHDVYLQVLRDLGVDVIELERLPDHPDAVFVEDPILVLDEVAVLLRPGIESRLGEVESLATAIAPFRNTVRIEAPATIDGGDLIRLGTTILAGVTSRTSSEGADALAALVAAFGYRVQTVPVTGCLHLKTAATALDPETLIAHSPFVDLSEIDAKVVEVDLFEAHGANIVRVGETVIADATAPMTLDLLASHGYQVVGVDVSEFAKAEGALSCKSVLFSG
ncbi:MAG: dimethylargininase [Acidimicrobiia bacterium]|nr:dimethylargininase [Acidimicrobiia bacterium]